MKYLPTDREILQAIWSEYFEEYARFNTDQSIRLTKVYVPIDIDRIAAKLGTEGDIVFGRLHYHLERKFAYETEPHHSVSFFSIELGDGPSAERHVINFPYMSAELARLREEHRTGLINIVAACVSASGAILSVVAAVVAMLRTTA